MMDIDLISIAMESNIVINVMNSLRLTPLDVHVVIHYYAPIVKTINAKEERLLWLQGYSDIKWHTHVRTNVRPIHLDCQST